MLRTVVTVYSGARALVNAALGLIFSLLSTFVGIRVALAGGWFETLVVLAVTVAMWFHTIRWFHRFRQTGRDATPVRHN